MAAAPQGDHNHNDHQCIKRERPKPRQAETLGQGSEDEIGLFFRKKLRWLSALPLETQKPRPKETAGAERDSLDRM